MRKIFSIMSKENQNQSDRICETIKRNDLVKKVITHFFTYTGKAIQKNAKQLQFWQNLLLESKDAKCLFRNKIESFCHSDEGRTPAASATTPPTV